MAEQEPIQLTPDEWAEFQKGVASLATQLSLYKAVPRGAEPDHQVARVSPAMEFLGVYGAVTERPRTVTRLTFETLRHMSHRTMVVPAILMTRILCETCHERHHEILPEPPYQFSEV